MQFFPALTAAGIEPVFLPLFSDAYLDALYSGHRSLREVARCYGRRLRQLRRARACDLIWIEKELLPFVPAAIENWLLRDRRYVLDFDDAIFHNYDLSSSAWVRRFLGSKIDRLMARARLVSVGNSYLQDRAVAAGAVRVERLPSVIDLARYRSSALARNPPPAGAPFVVVWIGSPATVRYLSLVREPLQQLAARRAIELRVIGAAAPDWPGVRAVSIAWSEETEAAQIAACDVGIMPLHDSPWERGKCGFKLVQYMASGLPVVASPIGINVDIVVPGVDGFLAGTAEQWEAALVQLANDQSLRQAMGQRGRAKVESRYSVQAVAPRLAELLGEAAG